MLFLYAEVDDDDKGLPGLFAIRVHDEYGGDPDRASDDDVDYLG